MKDLLDALEINYGCIFDEESEEQESKRMDTTTGRVVNRCIRSIVAWASEDQMVAKLFGR